jgi:transposase
MIVVGAVTHKRTHTLVAVDAATGSTRGELTIAASDQGGSDALRFAAGLDEQRVWAVEDCRHVTARLERALLGAGERVIRVPPSLTGESRKATRTAGKSDPIDARAVALAAIREGVESLPVAFLDEQAHEIRVLCDYRDQLMHERVRLINRLRWHLVRIAPHLEALLGPEALKGPRIRARLRVVKAQLRRINEITKEQKELFAELTTLIQAHAPQLLEQQSIGTVTAAIIIGRTAGAQRFRSEACFARHAGTAPIPASSGNTTRHRLHRGGDQATEPRDPHHRPRPHGLGPRDPRLYPTQGLRRQDQTRSDPLPQTPPRAPHLARPLRGRADAASPTPATRQHGRCRRARRHAIHRPKPANSEPPLT